MHLAQVDRGHFAGEYGRERRDGDGHGCLLHGVSHGADRVSKSSPSCRDRRARSIGGIVWRRRAPQVVVDGRAMLAHPFDEVVAAAAAAGKQDVAQLAARHHVLQRVDREHGIEAEIAAEGQGRQPGADDQRRHQPGGRSGDQEACGAAIVRQEPGQFRIVAQGGVVARQDGTAAVVEAEPAREAGRRKDMVARHEDRTERPGDRQDQQGHAADRRRRPLAAPQGAGRREQRYDGKADPARRPAKRCAGDEDLPKAAEREAERQRRRSTPPQQHRADAGEGGERRRECCQVVGVEDAAGRTEHDAVGDGPHAPQRERAPGSGRAAAARRTPAPARAPQAARSSRIGRPAVGAASRSGPTGTESNASNRGRRGLDRRLRGLRRSVAHEPLEVRCAPRSTPAWNCPWCCRRRDGWRHS